MKPFWKTMRVISSFILPCLTQLIRKGVVIIILFHSFQIQAQDSLGRANPNRLKEVIIGSGVAYTGSMIALSSVWYSQYDKQSFHFFNDAHEWKQMDKMGHLYSAFQLSSISSRTLQWTGVSKKKSDLAGTLTSFAIMSSIEVLDGFSSGYGASASDLAANAAGAGFYLGQQLIWNEIRIYPKFSFHRTSFAQQRPEALGSGLLEEIIKDYNGQTHWLSADMNKFLKFPKWLNLAVGYGAQNMLYANDASNINQNLMPYRQYFIGIDFDLTAIKSRSKLVNTLIYVANMVRLPAPALEISNGKVKGHLFYF
jgi:uncharacterized protein YfiM (DUF2279 family)